MTLKCAPCTDQAISDGQPDQTDIPDAVTIVPIVQTFTVGGQQIAAPVQIPVCYPCRKQQLGAVSRSGLAVA